MVTYMEIFKEFWPYFAAIPFAVLLGAYLGYSTRFLYGRGM